MLTQVSFILGPAPGQSTIAVIVQAIVEIEGGNAELQCLTGGAADTLKQRLRIHLQAKGGSNIDDSIKHFALLRQSCLVLLYQRGYIACDCLQGCLLHCRSSSRTIITSLVHKRIIPY